MKKKNSLFLYLKKYFIGLIYVFILLIVIVCGNERSNIVTTNINTVKSIKYSKITNIRDMDFYKKVTSTKMIKEYGKSQKLEFTGTLTGYGPDCVGCSGIVACRPNPDVRNNNIYYNDKEYGKIRILAADRSIPCGSIIKISNFKFIGDDFYGIVLDRGGAIVGLTMDLLYPSEKDTVVIGRQYKINFKIERWGY